MVEQNLIVLNKIGDYSGAPNDRIFSRYDRIVSDGFPYALEPSLVNLGLSQKIFICSDVLGGLFWSRKFFGGYFIFSETLSCPYGYGRSFKDMN